MAKDAGVNFDHTFVQLTQLSVKTVNPIPRSVSLLNNSNDDIINEGTLKYLSKCDDLASITSIELKIDVNKLSCGDFGAYLPNLRYLKLMNSFVPAVRELGSSFAALEVICMPRCRLKNLDGLSSMSRLTELYLAFNEIEDITPCTFLGNLEVIDLEGNLINDVKSIGLLKLCERLTTLSLAGNPIVEICGGIKTYRKYVRKTLKHIKFLDDQPVETITNTNSSNYNVIHFERDWEYINEVLKEIGLIADKKCKSAVTSADSSPNCSSVLTTEAITDATLPPGRCGPGIRPSTANKGECKSSGESASTSKCSSSFDSRPPSASSYVVEAEDPSEIDETASDLTTGQIVCGDISKALRNRRGSVSSLSASSARRNPQPTEQAPHPATQSTVSSLQRFKQKLKINITQPRSGSNRTLRKTMEQSEKARGFDSDSAIILKQENELRLQCDEVFKELAAWRKQHSKNQRLFHAKPSDARSANKQKPDAEGDLLLIATDSDSTIGDHSSSRNSPVAKSNRDSRSSIEHGDGRANRLEPSDNAGQPEPPIDTDGQLVSASKGPLIGNANSQETNAEHPKLVTADGAADECISTRTTNSGLKTRSQFPKILQSRSMTANASSAIMSAPNRSGLAASTSTYCKSKTAFAGALKVKSSVSSHSRTNSGSSSTLRQPLKAAANTINPLPPKPRVLHET